ncbi:MAG: gliding motility-associated protein GldE [Alistipes sp.]|mgnify:FL=1|nr:gliding motility-associated protein GldE [Alistipes sp.]MBQ3234336.1 gliding motility-associated protein GldE [Alistipes sp.]MBR2436001.1 gliding motility-associated protein GldE [Alistipes sp.]
MNAILLQENIDILNVVILGIISLVLLMLSAMASGSEVAFFSLKRADIADLESRSDASSRRVIDLLDNPDRLLATILVTNNMINICLVIVTTQIIDALFIFSGVWDFIFKTIVVTFLLLLFGEIMPKVFTQGNPVRMARFFSLPLKVFRWLVYPLAFILVRTSRHVSRLATKNAEISIEELADAVDLTETGSEEEQKMLSGIVNFGQTEVVEIMHSRVDITGLEFEADYNEVRRTIVETGYSRIPVYGDDLDDVRGVLYVKDLLPYLSEGNDFEWQKLLRKPYFVPEHMMIDDLLKKFQKKKIHIAIVVDEYGATQGLVSLEDILEEVVGEITDESDEEENELYEKIGERTWIFDAKIHIGEFLRAIDFEEDAFADVEGHAETLAGLMMELKRDLPRRGDELQSHGVKFFIATMDGRRVDKIKVEVDG